MDPSKRSQSNDGEINQLFRICLTMHLKIAFENDFQLLKYKK